MTKPVLYYIYDPMCSWCWGYRPTWLALQEQLHTTALEIQYRVGGLAPDSDAPMPNAMQAFLAQTWQKISAQLGTQFNFDFWLQCQPRRSTYPACRAVLIAREAGLEQAMYFAIQQAYYLHAKNPSDNELLVELAVAVGLDGTLFEQKLNSDKLHQQLVNEIEQVRKMPMQGFPSLVLAVNNQLFPIPIDYQHWQSSYDAIIQRL